VFVIVFSNVGVLLIVSLGSHTLIGCKTKINLI